jgi:hypothetical protein
MHSAPFWELLGQHAPLAAAFEQVQYGAEHFIQVHAPGAGFLACAFQQRPDGLKSLCTDVAGVTLSHLPSFSQIHSSERL